MFTFYHFSWPNGIKLAIARRSLFYYGWECMLALPGKKLKVGEWQTTAKFIQNKVNVFSVCENETDQKCCNLQRCIPVQVKQHGREWLEKKNAAKLLSLILFPYVAVTAVVAKYTRAQITQQKTNSKHTGMRHRHRGRPSCTCMRHLNASQFSHNKFQMPFNDTFAYNPVSGVRLYAWLCCAAPRANEWCWTAAAAATADDGRQHQSKSHFLIKYFPNGYNRFCRWTMVMMWQVGIGCMALHDTSCRFIDTTLRK